MNNTSRTNKIKGAVYGFAIGDAMGATTEFMNPTQIAIRYGTVTDIIGGGWLGLKAGQVTDDTQMTLCVMRAIMDSNTSEEFLNNCSKNFEEWYDSNPPDVGNQCAKGIRYLKLGVAIPEDDRALGNGTLMRALPCAIIQSRNWNYIQNDMTHNNKICRAIIDEYSGMITSLIKTGKLSASHKVYMNVEITEPTGYIINTFNNAVYWLVNSSSIKEAVISAVNHGGDADTIAAITGSLVGARDGFDHIPKEWVNKLDKGVCKELDRFVDYVVNYGGM